MNVLALLCPLGLLFVGVVGAGVLGFLAWRSGQNKVKAARVIKCKIADMRDGDVCRVKGRLVTREEPLRSPLSDKPCIYYRFKVDQAYETRTWTTSYNSLTVLSGVNESISDRETWQTIIEEVQRVAVALEDETGRAYLDLGDARLDDVTVTKEGVIDTSKEGGLSFELMLQKRYGESTLVDRRSGVRQAFSRRVSRMSQGRELPKASAHEEIIENGAEVYVVGEVEVREGKTPRFRPVDHPLLVTRKARRASLPTPSNPAMGLWIAAGVVLGVTALLTLVSSVVICAGALSPPGPRGAPPPSRTFPGR